ncbi:hypothetical protein [Virgibacillus senegalensis]|uniref:hypothetical protein n=1 Tax=Virgibacillus senegalensis TaxID=1499679 RepID=UPI00069E3C58|nr:hypothetical protein [Virgibacillus senegalensis]
MFTIHKGDAATGEFFDKFVFNNVGQVSCPHVPHVVKNGTLDKKVLQQEPFRTVGSIVSLFKEDMDDARKILGIADEIYRNAEEISGA